MTNFIEADFERPILFRTMEKDVYEKTLASGSVWLRTSHYYRAIEDDARVDKSEGVNTTTSSLPLSFKSPDGVTMTVKGEGGIGREIIPHYIMSLHGSAIRETIRNEFGGNTLGVRCFWRLASDVFLQASKQLELTGYRYGAVSYQHTALLSSKTGGGSAFTIGKDDPIHIRSASTDVLRKAPIEPFIGQDEWRIVLFPRTYLSNDIDEPLKINVDPSNFYRYSENA